MKSDERRIDAVFNEDRNLRVSSCPSWTGIIFLFCSVSLCLCGKIIRLSYRIDQ